MEDPTTTTTTTTTSAANSPEFEFWMVRNPSSHHTTLPSADQLFSDGVLLPLRRLTVSDHPPDLAGKPTNPPETDQTQDSDLKPTPTSSKRWKDIFKKNPEPKNTDQKKKKKDRYGGAGAGAVTGTGTGAGTAELNINLWPFSRSRSAGTAGGRPRTAAGGGRKVSSAPCSRSNSTGDKHRKWPTSPGRVGVHLGRSSPVWQAKRVGHPVEKGSRLTKSLTSSGAGGNGKVLNVNVPACIGYRKSMGCRSDVSKEGDAGGVAGGSGGVTAVGDGGATGLFSFRSLFTKKVF